MDGRAKIAVARKMETLTGAWGPGEPGGGTGEQEECSQTASGDGMEGQKKGDWALLER
jgi:hypothetical protein